MCWRVIRRGAGEVLFHLHDMREVDFGEGAGAVVCAGEPGGGFGGVSGGDGGESRLDVAGTVCKRCHFGIGLRLGREGAGMKELSCDA